MQAVIKCGGHQYRVSEGDTLRVDKLEAEVGQILSLEEVLMVSDGGALKFGSPYLEGARVELKVIDQTRDPKIRVFKFKRRKNYKRTRGHRQHVSVVRVVKIGI